jgi:hypothetical protein
MNKHNNCNNSNFTAILEYKVWNLTEAPNPNFLNYFDIVLDKGCLDTFLFRTRMRGSSGTGSSQIAVVPPLLYTVLHNVAACLVVPGTPSNTTTTITDTTDSKDQDNTSQIVRHYGQYKVLSPRRKIKCLRDHPDFTVTTKTGIPVLVVPTTLQQGVPNNTVIWKDHDSTIDNAIMGDLEGRRRHCHQNDTNNSINTITYLHCAIKKKISDTSPQSDNTTTQQMTSTDNPITDESTCPTCHVTFRTFRRGEHLNNNGRVLRRWKGHCRHCVSEKS